MRWHSTPPAPPAAGDPLKARWKMVAAGCGLNLALGGLYAWSVFARALMRPVATGGYGWSSTQASLPYVTAIVCLAGTMVPAGLLQDRFGPRRGATLGAVLVGLGLVISSWASPARVWPAVLGFGFLSGTGIGLGYASATPAALKWFPERRRGLVAGAVVGGFGLAPVYFAPLSSWLLAEYGIRTTFCILAVGLAIAAGLCAQVLRNPPGAAAAAPSPQAPGGRPHSWQSVLRDPNFFTLYFQYCGGSIAGLMIIGHLAEIVAIQSHDRIKAGYWLVALLAVFNAGGRLAAGALSDRIGRDLAIALFALIQTGNLLCFRLYADLPLLATGAAVAGFNYGACASLFPAATGDAWGSRCFGRNYGMLFSAWGVAGIIGPLLAARIVDATGGFVLAYQVAAGVLLLTSALALLRRTGMPRSRNLG